MALTNIPLLIFVPGTYAELTSRSSGLAIQPHETLIVGQKLASGAMNAGEVYACDSASEASMLAGAESQLAEQVAGYKQADNLTPVSIVGVADAVGTHAVGTVTITGVATESRALVIYCSGRRIVVGVAAGDSFGAITAKAIAAAALVSTPCTIANVDGAITFTARHTGSIGDQIQIGHSQLPGERPPAGVTVTVAQMASGATDPDYSDVITAMADSQYNTIATGLVEDTATGLLVTELERRWGPLAQIDGVMFGAFADTRANLTTLGNSYNSGLFVLAGVEQSPLMETPWETAAKVAALSALQTQADPALAPTGDLLPGSRAAKRGQRFTFDQRNTLLSDGIATLAASSDSRLQIERLVTTYQKNAQGLPDSALRDLHKVRTLSAMRFSFRAMVGSKYAKAKLAGDSPVLPSGQLIVTPSLMRAEIIALAEQWVQAGWMEGGSMKQFRSELVVQRNDSDSSRLEALIPPDLMDNLFVTAARIAAVG